MTNTAVIRMNNYSPEKLIAILSGFFGAILAGFKLWKVLRPKVAAWRAVRRARKAAIDTVIAKLDDIAERQSRIELAMSFTRSVGEMTLVLADVAAWKSNAQGECTFVAPALAELFGMDQSRALGNGWVSALHPADRAAILEEYRQAVREQRVFDSYYRYRQPDGTIVYIHGIAYPAVNHVTGKIEEYWGRAKAISKEDWMRFQTA